MERGWPRLHRWPQSGRDWSTGRALLSDWLQWVSFIPTDSKCGKPNIKEQDLFQNTTQRFQELN